MKNIDYRHKSPVSFTAKLIQSIMGLAGLKGRMERRMMSDGFDREPVNPPGSLRKGFDVELQEQSGRSVWTVSPINRHADVVILFLHGGAYMANITRQHWDLIRQLAKHTKGIVVVPDYPLAPVNACEETFLFMRKLYARLLTEYQGKRIILAGDSAGGGLALGFVQQLRNEHARQPEQIILFSPWLDVSLNHPEIKPKEKWIKY
jgi:epsilon-lactone hydrolase